MRPRTRRPVNAMAAAILCWFACWLAFGLFVATAHAAEPFRGTVVGVTDGDTLTVLSRGETRKIRLAEIDAPEKRQAFGERARQSLAALCFNERVEVSAGKTDFYGRTVARVKCQGMDASLHQVQQGLAWAYTAYLTDQGIAAAAGLARDSGVGLWADADPVAPWLFRKARK